MQSEQKTKSMNFIRIMSILKSMLNSKTISEKEYYRAKKYYRKLTGADIAIPD